MKIAILSDIHGNSVALKAVLEEARCYQIQKLILLGDYVGYYYHPKDVLDLLEEWDVEMIAGNHDGMTFLKGKKLDEVKQKFGSGIEVAKKTLSKEQLALLLKLPETKKIKIDGLSILLAHGSPQSNEEYVYPDASINVLRRCVQKDIDFVLLGHTHHAFVLRIEKTLIVNPGSVGQSRDLGVSSSWAILDTMNGAIIPVRTRYDVDDVLAEAKKNDPNIPYLQNILKRGGVTCTNIS